MRLARLLSLVVFVSLLHLPATAVTACADGTLLLSEIVAGPARDWDGSGTFSSRDDEWVEVVNPGTTALDLAAFLLTDGDSIPRFAFTGMLEPSGRRVVFGGQSLAWERVNGLPAFGLSLGNSGDSVLLWKVTGTDTVIVDTYAYRSHEAAADRAVARGSDETWQLFDQLNPYTGTLLPPGNGCAPTPGLPNLCSLTPAATTSWGRLKSIYR